MVVITFHVDRVHGTTMRETLRTINIEIDAEEETVFA